MSDRVETYRSAEDHSEAETIERLRRVAAQLKRPYRILRNGLEVERSAGWSDKIESMTFHIGDAH